MKRFGFGTMVILGLALAAVFPGAASAAKFANQFTEFELPPQWQCNLEGAEWVCQSTNEAKKKDAIIVLAAKIKGDQDSLDQYLAYLKAAKTFTSVQGKPVKSEPKYAEIKNLNGHPWVDSLHLESEIPGFYTRYLATVKQDIGVLVTYSVNKNKWTDYTNDFENLVRTLKVFRKAGSLTAAPNQGNIFQQTQIPQTLSEGSVFPNANPQGGSDVAIPAEKKKEGLPLGLVLVGVGVLGFLMLRRKRAG